MSDPVTPDYNVGIVAKPDGFATFMWQSINMTVESDEYSVKDHNGNTAVITHRDHRAKATLEAVIPKNTPVPVVGQTVGLVGIDLPTVSTAGVCSGTFGLNSANSTAVAFTVTGTPQISQSNTDYTKASIEVTRYLVNGLPA